VDPANKIRVRAHESQYIRDHVCAIRAYFVVVSGFEYRECLLGWIRIHSLARGTSSSAFRGLSRLGHFSMSWPFVVLHPRITCVLFRGAAVRLWLCCLLRMSLAYALPLIITLWRHIGCSPSRGAMLLMSRNVRDAMSPRVLSVAMSPPPQPRLLLCPGSGRRSPCLLSIFPVVLTFSHYVIRLHNRTVHAFLRSSWLRRRQLKGGTCVWRFAESGLGPHDIALGMSCDWILRLCIGDCFGWGCDGHYCAHAFQPSGCGGFALRLGISHRCIVDSIIITW
jgi:hypothetical protein